MEEKKEKNDEFTWVNDWHHGWVCLKNKKKEEEEEQEIKFEEGDVVFLNHEDFSGYYYLERFQEEGEAGLGIQNEGLERISLEDEKVKKMMEFTVNVFIEGNEKIEIEGSLKFRKSFGDLVSMVKEELKKLKKNDILSFVLFDEEDKEIRIIYDEDEEREAKENEVFINPHEELFQIAHKLKQKENKMIFSAFVLTPKLKKNPEGKIDVSPKLIKVSANKEGGIINNVQREKDDKKNEGNIIKVMTIISKTTRFLTGIEFEAPKSNMGNSSGFRYIMRFRSEKSKEIIEECFEAQDPINGKDIVFFFDKWLKIRKNDPVIVELICCSFSKYNDDFVKNRNNFGKEKFLKINNKKVKSFPICSFNRKGELFKNKKGLLFINFNKHLIKNILLNLTIINE